MSTFSTLLGFEHDEDHVPLLGVYFSEFDIVVGPKLVTQHPPGLLTGEQFEAVSDFLFAGSELSHNAISVDVLGAGVTLLSFPIQIWHDRYARNSFYFNVGFVVPSACAGRAAPMRALQAALCKVAAWLEMVELDHQLLEGHVKGRPLQPTASPARLALLSRLCFEIHTQLARRGTCTITLRSSQSLSIKLPPARAPAMPRLLSSLVPVRLAPFARLSAAVLDPIVAAVATQVDDAAPLAVLAHRASLGPRVVAAAVRHLTSIGALALLPPLHAASVLAPAPGPSHTRAHTNAHPATLQQQQQQHGPGLLGALGDPRWLARAAAHVWPHLLSSNNNNTNNYANNTSINTLNSVGARCVHALAGFLASFAPLPQQTLTAAALSAPATTTSAAPAASAAASTATAVPAVNAGVAANGINSSNVSSAAAANATSSVSGSETGSQHPQPAASATDSATAAAAALSPSLSPLSPSIAHALSPAPAAGVSLAAAVAAARHAEAVRAASISASASSDSTATGRVLPLWDDASVLRAVRMALAHGVLVQRVLLLLAITDSAGERGDSGGDCERGENSDCEHCDGDASQSDCEQRSDCELDPDMFDDEAVFAACLPPESTSNGREKGSNDDWGDALALSSTIYAPSFDAGSDTEASPEPESESENETAATSLAVVSTAWEIAGSLSAAGVAAKPALSPFDDANRTQHLDGGHLEPPLWVGTRSLVSFVGRDCAPFYAQVAQHQQQAQGQSGTQNQSHQSPSVAAGGGVLWASDNPFSSPLVPTVTDHETTVTPQLQTQPQPPSQASTQAQSSQPLSRAQSPKQEPLQQQQQQHSSQAQAARLLPWVRTRALRRLLRTHSRSSLHSHAVHTHGGSRDAHGDSACDCGTHGHPSSSVGVDAALIAVGLGCDVPAALAIVAALVPGTVAVYV